MGLNVVEINSIFSIYEFLKISVMLRLLIYSDYLYINITLLGNGVLQLVSEQVGPSEQLVESCRAM